MNEKSNAAPAVAKVINAGTQNWWTWASQGTIGFFAGLQQIPGMATAETAKLQQSVIEGLYKDGVCIAISGLFLYNHLWLIADCTRDFLLLLPEPSIEQEASKGDNHAPMRTISSILKSFLAPLRKPYAFAHEYVRNIPRTGADSRGCVPIVFLIVCTSVEQSLLRSHFCKSRPPWSQFILQTLILPTAAVWCIFKSEHDASKEKDSTIDDCHDNSRPSSVQISTKKLKVAFYSAAGLTLFWFSSNNYFLELFKVSRDKSPRTWIQYSLSWVDGALGLGPVVDLGCLIFGIPSFGLGTVAGSLRKYITVSPNGAQFAMLPTALNAGKIISSASGVLIWLMIKRHINLSPIRK
jgi:hypothetical protein